MPLHFNDWTVFLFDQEISWKMQITKHFLDKLSVLSIMSTKDFETKVTEAYGSERSNRIKYVQF